MPRSTTLTALLCSVLITPAFAQQLYEVSLVGNPAGQMEVSQTGAHGYTVRYQFNDRGR